jgi:hypothetical protein
VGAEDILVGFAVGGEYELFMTGVPACNDADVHGTAGMAIV